MAAILEIHRVLSNTTWLFFFFLGVWGLYRAFRREAVDGSYMGALVIAELLFIIQGILGLIMGLGPASFDEIHVLYGVFGIVFLPFIYFYQRGDDSNRAQWVYAFATLFMFGIALRAIQTAP